MSKNIDNKFVRFGKLHLTKQNGYGKDTFHSPPSTCGIYCFPIRFQEWFLIGCLEDTQPKQLQIPKKILDENGMVINYEDRGDKWSKRISEIRHEFTVNDEDLVWHHLDVKHNLIIEQHNSWVKTTVGVFKKCLIKESLRLRVLSGGKIGINSAYKRTGIYSKDHFEVFFDTKVF